LKSIYCSCKTGCNTSRCGCQKSQMQWADVFVNVWEKRATGGEEADETDDSDDDGENTFS